MAPLARPTEETVAKGLLAAANADDGAGSTASEAPEAAELWGA